MVSRASGGLGDDTVEPQCRQIQFVDERFNNPDRVILRHVVIQAGSNAPCRRSSPSTKRFIPPSPNSRTLNYHVRRFHTALRREQTSASAVRTSGSSLTDLPAGTNFIALRALIAAPAATAQHPPCAKKSPSRGLRARPVRTRRISHIQSRSTRCYPPIRHHHLTVA